VVNTISLSLLIEELYGREVKMFSTRFIGHYRGKNDVAKMEALLTSFTRPPGVRPTTQKNKYLKCLNTKLLEELGKV